MSDKSISDLQRENAELRKEIEQLRAQPARQVGGDERGQFEAWLSSLKFVAGQGQDHVAYCLHRDLSDSYTVEWVRDMWRGWKSRAALAPAAVDEIARVKNAAREIRDHLKKEVARLESDLEHARKKVLVVMPEKKESRQFDPAGWNAALDEVARLNRRAIPVELLERILNWREGDAGDSGRDELRTQLAAQQAAVPEELDSLLDWFEGLLHSYDWLGTGSDQAVADAEEAEAWEKWERLSEIVTAPAAPQQGVTSDDLKALRQFAQEQEDLADRSERLYKAGGEMSAELIDRYEVATRRARHLRDLIARLNADRSAQGGE